MDIEESDSDIEDVELKEYINEIYQSRVGDYTKCKTYDIVPNTVAIHPSGISSVAGTRHMRWLYTGGEDGEIRKYDFINSINGQSLLTQVQKHSFVETVTQNAVILSSWENDEYVTEEDDYLLEQYGSKRPKLSEKKDEKLSKKELKLEQEFNNEIQKQAEYLYRRKSPVYSLDIHSQAIFGLSGLKSGTINLWTLRHDEGTCHHNFREHNGIVSCIKLNADEKAFASGSWDKTVKLWDLNTGKAIQTYKEHKTQLSSIAYQPKNLAENDPISDTPIFMRPTEDSLLLTTSADGKTYLWDKRTDTPARSLILNDTKTPPWALSSCWGADGNMAYIGRRNSTIDEWDIKEGKLIRQLSLPKGSGPVYNVRCLPNGKQIICASNDNIRMWNLKENETVLDVEHILSNKLGVPQVPFIIIPGHHGGMVSDIFIDPTCRFMITASGNRGWEEKTTNICLFYTIKPIKN
ncbi:WD40 repeat-like protein [Anaeromyces robustus]|uniref:WD40 repeat-like protein n=1 Tax=Anaeromyces robustus TaxID=1754192 RepID=A0A1Y1X7P5_9FUNG|nr:WD40 repeat-like protein [Anaeromyces robustus]|eukprot:ORX81755.1 WD40 repeat-like protein [Anaeromyces robustus]